MSTLRSRMRNASAVWMVTGLLMVGSTLIVANSPQASAQKQTAQKAVSKPVSRPAASPRPGAGGSNVGGAAHGASSPGSKGGGPSANGRGTSAPSAKGSAKEPRAATGMHAESAGAGHSEAKASAPRGSNDHASKNGSTVRTRANGRVSDVHDSRRGMDVHHGLSGNQRVSMERHDGSRLVTERGRRGFVGHPYGFHGHDFERRSYFYQGHAYQRLYRGYGYHGVFLNVYAPGAYYGAGFYGWAYNPWTMPIAFNWGWGGSPWQGYYGGYFQPYAVYPSAASWLTDYMISQDLQADYAAHQSGGEVGGTEQASGGGPALTPDVKQQIADEVRGELALENAEAAQTAQHQDVDPSSSGIARMMADGHSHVFVVGDALDLVDANGNECAISDGDALLLQTPPSADSTAATLVVLASKGGQECQKSSAVTVNLTDLQEMQNHMRETIDRGLQELQAKQGTGGLPKAPPSAQGQPTQTELAALAPPISSQDSADLQQQDQQANQAEQEATGAAPVNNSQVGTPSAAPTSIAIGQTIDQVRASMGSPERVAELGPKVIYYYSGMKIVFKNGTVSDVE